MLEITRASMTDGRITYALSGEITADQIERLEALVRTAFQRGRSIRFDLKRVWRIDHEAAALIARHACSPDERVGIVGLPAGLLEWLRTIANEHP